MKTLAIETSCDDTSIGIITYDDGFFGIEGLLAYSQISDHQKYGGIVPEVAYRIHSEKIIPLLTKIGRDIIRECDNISVTSNPGLPGSLLIGLSTAHMLGSQLNKPVQEINHIHGHLASILLERRQSDLPFPWVVLSASGGHNELYHITLNGQVGANHRQWSDLNITQLGSTLDDAAGECFDKVARMLGGSYPGGPWVAAQAAQASKKNIFTNFKPIMLDHTRQYDFSFSGMKAQAYQLLNELNSKEIELTEGIIHDICDQFEQAITTTLWNKLLLAAQHHQAATVGIVGGVSANDRLRNLANNMKEKIGQSVVLVRPYKKIYSTDNAAMIGVVGLLQ